MTTVSDPTEVVLEVLYLDAQTCDPCRATIDAVDAVAAALTAPLREQGRTLAIRSTRVVDQEQADALGFVSSPTVRVDGVDIELDVHEQHCGSCSALAGRQVDCRTFDWQGTQHPSPPAEMIARRVLDHLNAELPESAAPAAGHTSSVARFLRSRAEHTAQTAEPRARV